MNKNLLLLAMSLALLMSAAAQAQTTHLTITVPFKFTAGNVQLPAGEYEVTAVGPWGGPTLSVHNVNSNAGTLVLSTSSRSQKPTADAKLVFHRYGNQYFLAEVWNRHSSLGNQIQDQLAASGVGKEPIEGRSRADRVGEVMMLAQFQFRPGGSP